MKLKLYEADLEHLSELQTLAHRIWWAHYPSIISEDQIEYMLRENYSLDALKQQFEEGVVFNMVETEGKTIGFVAVAPSKKDKSSLFIHKFYIETNQHGKGIGSFVFQKIAEKYHQFPTLRLAVNRQNYKSINFYFKNGFAIEKCLDTPIGNGYVMDDFIMEWRRG